MPSDITNAVVVALQGNAVQSGTLGSGQDGYVLTWKNSDNEWEAKPSVGLQSQTFTSNGTWTCPGNVYNIWLNGFGGGGGGTNGIGSTGGGGGGGAINRTCVVPVEPGTTYNITIGAGGTAGNGGERTDFDTIVGFVGGANGSVPAGGSNQSNSDGSVAAGLQLAGYGGDGGTAGNVGHNGYYPGLQFNYNNVSPGTGGTATTGAGGGGGGGCGPGIITGSYKGGDGGNAGAGSTAGGNGGNGTANSGSGGGGGGGSESGTPGTGGTGGSGQLTVSWIG